MKSLRALPALLLTSLKSIRAAVPGEGISAQAEQGKGQSLLRLHEYQHRVILEIFKITIAGFLAFSLLLLAFAVIVNRLIGRTIHWDWVTIFGSIALIGIIAGRRLRVL